MIHRPRFRPVVVLALALVACGPAAHPARPAPPSAASLSTLASTPGAASATTAPSPDPRWSALARDLPKLLADHRIPSVSLARIEHGELVWRAAYGTQVPGVPATPETLYNIASLTKPISSEVVLRLAAAGRLSLDEPMSTWWIDPDLARDARHARLTPRIALSHQTGFANWRRDTGGVLAFNHAPGEQYGYSGEGFEYVARFVEHKLGTSFEALAQALVLDPARMTSTAYTGRPWFADRIATPTDATGAALEPTITRTLVASDLMYSTPSDYARFLLGVLAHTGLTPALAAERQRIHVSRKAETCTGALAPVCPRDVGIGLSWEVFELGDASLVMHTGSDPGVFTLAYLNLTTRSGTVIFTNSAQGAQIVLPILDRIGADPQFVAILRAATR